MNDNNTNVWSDFNDAEAQQSGFNLIPKGALVPVLMTLKPGGHYDASQGWTDGYPTQSSKTGAVKTRAGDSDYCTDCTRAYQHQMIKQCRCLHAKTRFFVDCDGYTEGRRPVSERLVNCKKKGRR